MCFYCEIEIEKIYSMFCNVIHTKSEFFFLYHVDSFISMLWYLILIINKDKKSIQIYPSDRDPEYYLFVGSENIEIYRIV